MVPHGVGGALVGAAAGAGPFAGLLGGVRPAAPPARRGGRAPTPPAAVVHAPLLGQKAAVLVEVLEECSCRISAAGLLDLGPPLPLLCVDQRARARQVFCRLDLEQRLGCRWDRRLLVPRQA